MPVYGLPINAFRIESAIYVPLNIPMYPPIILRVKIKLSNRLEFPSGYVIALVIDDFRLSLEYLGLYLIENLIANLTVSVKMGSRNYSFFMGSTYF